MGNKKEWWRNDKGIMGNEINDRGEWKKRGDSKKKQMVWSGSEKEQRNQKENGKGMKEE